MEAKTTDMQPSPEHDIVQRLQQENVALRAELQALRSTTQLQLSHATAHAGHEQTFDFMKLPRELRNLVYEVCVVVGNVQIGKPARFCMDDMRCHQRRDAAAATSLFAVSKRIRHEALELYLSRNHFITTAADMETSYGYNADPLRRIPGLKEPQAFANLRSVSVSIGVHDSTRCAHHNFEGSTDFHFSADSSEEIQSMVSDHNDLSVELCEDFRNILEGVFESSTKLRKLQINLQRVACVLGCHRMVDALFDYERTRIRLRQFALRAKKLETLDFLGTVSDQERQAIRWGFPKSIRKKITFHGPFDNDHGLVIEVEVLDETPNQHDALDSSSEDSSWEDSSSE
jgi:hypothetical protein